MANYTVWLEAFNGYIWSNSTVTGPLMNLTIYNDQLYYLPDPKVFKTVPPTYVFDLVHDYKDENPVINLPLVVN